MQRLTVVPEHIIEHYMDEAKALMDKIDPKDTTFIAAALAAHASIWSEDKDFLQQTKVQIYSTKKLLDYLNSQ